jgi:hypothetical protein
LIIQLFTIECFVDSKSGRTFDLHNPSTEKKIDSIQDAQLQAS